MPGPGRMGVRRWRAGRPMVRFVPAASPRAGSEAAAQQAPGRIGAELGIHDYVFLTVKAQSCMIAPSLSPYRPATVVKNSGTQRTRGGFPGFRGRAGRISRSL